ncbi:putative lipid II flippase MurJ [Alsobacter metallidurans]|uniref:Probable lipid II flippase MurJ n=1 Tax=Alsobacter metallidurans TaxID=340221 RepID=A0A917IAZ5_9HYPH|nr:murein biosynthesis integral membrane protein MurJ [Alsobacter metallidurans]GGH33762.1 putative lipid II flippase MurJ [Alsobacter metallidurans]
MTTTAAERPPAATIARDSAVVGAGAGASRILGFVRDVLIAALLGAGPAADALLVALRVPNLLRRVVGEGAVNGAFTPVYARVAAETGHESARRFAGESIVALSLAVAVAFAFAELLAPWIVLALAGGFGNDPERLNLSVHLLRWTLALVPATVLSALLAALLAAEGRLRWAALAPAAINGILVVTLFGLAQSPVSGAQATFAVAAAVSLAGAVQLAFVSIPLLRGSARPILSWPTRSPALRQAIALAVPGLATAASAQFSILAAMYLASDQPAALAHLHYADRLFQLPLGFVAAGAGVVLLNEVVRLGRAGHTDAVGPLMDQAILLALLLALPAAAGLAVLSLPISSVLFERGAFSGADAAAVAAAIAGLSLGLPAAAIARVLAQPFLAVERSRPPLLGALAALAATILVGLALRAPYGVAGLGAAVSVGAWVDALVLAWALRTADWWRPGARFARHCTAVAFAAGAMAAVVVLARAAAGPWLDIAAPIWTRGVALAAMCGGGALVYAAILLACGARNWRKPQA